MTETFTNELTHDWDDPYYYGAQRPASDSDLFPVEIAGRGFLVDTTQQGYQRNGIQLLRSQANREAGESLMLPPEVWRRRAESWHQGFDQLRFDREDALPYRFYRSRGINPWEPWGISLLPDTTKIADLVSARSHMAVANGRTLVADGLSMLWWDSMISPVQNIGLTSPVVSMTSDGQNFYYVTQDRVIHKRTSVGSETTLATLSFDATMLRYVKGFLVAAAGNSLYDVTGATPLLIYTSPLPDFRWVDACEGLSVAYVLGGIGDRWMVHRMGILDDATTFNPPIVAAQLPDGEVGKSLGSYLGFVLVGSDQGFRFGVPSSTGDISYGRLVTTPFPVECFEGQDRFVWFGVSLTATPSSPAKFMDWAGLGRMDLSVFVAPQTPAAAADLGSKVLGRVCNVATVAGKRIFTVEGVGVYLQSDELVLCGWVEQGEMNFGVVDPKIGLYAQVNHEPLSGTIKVEHSIDGKTLHQIASNNATGSTFFGNIPLDGERFGTASFRLVLCRDEVSTTRGPRVTRFECRAVPSIGKASEWRVPLVIADDLNIFNVTTPRSVSDDYDFLMSLIETGRPFTYREGGKIWTVYAVDFQWRLDKPARDGSAWQGVFTLVCREVR